MESHPERFGELGGGDFMADRAACVDEADVVLPFVWMGEGQEKMFEMYSLAVLS